MAPMVSDGCVLSRSLAALLALFLSFGAISCAGADTHVGKATAPTCCARDDAGGVTEGDTGLGALSPPCLGTCPAAGLPVNAILGDGVYLVPPSRPPDPSILGRVLAPDPFPPRSSTMV